MTCRSAAPSRASVATVLWVDCTAGAIVGVVVLVFGDRFGPLHGLPRAVLLVLGIANLVYAAYSFSLVRRRRRTVRQVAVLVYANAAWGCVCIGLAVRYWEQAGPVGFVHLFGEVLFVGVLAALEWRQRHRLAGGVVAVRGTGVPASDRRTP